MKNWKNQFFEVKKIGEEPPLNKDGFWKKPKKSTADYIKNVTEKTANTKE